MDGDANAAEKTVFGDFVTRRLQNGGVFVAKAPGWV
jgi:hypothetical protein